MCRDGGLAGGSPGRQSRLTNVPCPPETVHTRIQRGRCARGRPGFAFCFLVTDLSKLLSSKMGTGVATPQSFLQRLCISNAQRAPQTAGTPPRPHRGTRPPARLEPGGRWLLLLILGLEAPPEAPTWLPQGLGCSPSLRAPPWFPGLPRSRLEPCGQWVVGRSDTSHFQSWPLKSSCSNHPDPPVGRSTQPPDSLCVSRLNMKGQRAPDI